MSKPVYLVAVDGSDCSERAAERAVNIAQKTDAEVRFVTVVPWAKYYPLYMPEVSPPIVDKKADEETERKEILEPLMRRFKDSGVPLSAKIFWGHPVEVIHEQSKKNHANMIFVGRQGRSKVKDLLLGSVANSLAHKAGIPIVLVP
ncbi:universal stress protein [Paremcibacter congregatus]|uniref:Universal stress protein n=1 Tax=Paremcibacter congregatus TaxID=2043170 RepID=A0A2G4YWQ8_9PROT|nr:universal stress protein [Paremcibacter congregatus]PHZ85876.1 universal stress protein [Paremcibacter congregatus]QDE26840.1 universal stress protein [Paremcibacter congregatus]